MMVSETCINPRPQSSLRASWLVLALAFTCACGSSEGKVLTSGVTCSNGQSVDPTTDVILTGPTVWCEFTGMEIFASLKLQDGASAMLSGGSLVHGSVECFECGQVKLISVDVLGAVILTRGQSLDVGADVALPGGISVEGPGTQYVHVDGSAQSMLAYRPNITSISAIEPGELHIRHANVASSISARGTTQVVIDRAIVVGEVHVEASTRSDGVAIGASEIGSLKISGTSGDINVGQQTTIASSLLVHGGRGEVHVFGSSVAGELHVIERHGRVLLADSPSISAGVKIEKCNGDVVATGLEVVNGAVSISECEGDCDVRITASSISLGIFVLSGQGRIDVLRVSMPSGDLIVSDRQARTQESEVALVVVDSIVSDVLMERIEGSLEVANVSADSDMTMTQIEGGFTLMSSVVQGDFKLDFAQAVAVVGSNFKKEDVMLNQISGRIAIVGNWDFNLVLTENQGDVLLRDNYVDNLDLSKNSGLVELINNTIEILTCADNTLEPVIHAENSFLEPVVGRPQSGQCSVPQ